MGWRFPIEYANIVAYLTTPRLESPLFLKHHELAKFLESLQDEQADREPLISSDPNWIVSVRTMARHGLETLSRSEGAQSDKPLPKQLVNHILHRLKGMLGDYKFFGMAVGSQHSFKESESFIEKAAYSSKHHAIFLLPQFDRDSSVFECLTPFGPISLLCEQPETWPGILFWSKTGSAAFATLKEAPPLFERLLAACESADESGINLENLDRSLRDFQPEKKSKVILHLSDLHFGPDVIAERQSYLLAHLESVIKSVDRIVITGDLLNNPRDHDALAFNSFRDALKRSTNKDIIVIPGNHDSKLMGNSWKFLGKNRKQLADLEWRNLVVDDDIRCVFFCFDSSLNADWARGRITTGQTLRMATDFENERIANPALIHYHPIALIHHHPFSFETAQETKLQKALAFFGYSDERFLRMLDAQKFLVWCAKRRIPLILHGHKHVPRHINQEISFSQGKQKISREVTAIGCGSSLGAENSPMSYDILRWNPSTGRWSIAFFADTNDGSGFIEQYVALRTQETWSDNIRLLSPIRLQH